MSIAYFHSHEYSSCKSIQESRNRIFSKNWIQVSWQPSIDTYEEESVSTKNTQSIVKYVQMIQHI